MRDQITASSFDNFGIVNYRSFGNSPEFIKPMKKINLFIGKNNCGKSNILKFISSLSNWANGKQFPFNQMDLHNREGVSPSIYFNFSVEDLNLPATYANTNSQFNRSYFHFNFSDPITIKLNLSNNDFTIDALSDLSLEQIQSILSHYRIHQPGNSLHHYVMEFFQKKLIYELTKPFFKKVIYIPDLRFIKEGAGQIPFANADIHGSNIITEIFKMQNPGIGEDYKKKQLIKITQTVQSLLDEKDLFIEIPHTKDSIIINLNGTRLPLEYFGTGIHELVLLCSALIIHNEHIVCIEEPEIHLHPELQRKFYNFLLTTNNTYFITTHSNSFLDFTNDKVSINHVSYSDGRSKITCCNTNKLANNILTDLGYKTSDLLQANGIIWVEGPSDRIYLQKWISMKRPDLIEGIHFSILFYGGKLLSHLSYDFEYLENELIALCKINRNSFVIMDSDITKSRRRINETKKRIASEIGRRNYWVTKGKEIENYLSKKLLEDWQLNKHGKSIQISDFTLKDDIAKTLLKAGAKISYESSKPKYAREIASLITATDFQVYDLDKKINEIIVCIDQWNA